MIIVNGIDYYNVVVIQDMHRMGEHAMYGHRQGVIYEVSKLNFVTLR